MWVYVFFQQNSNVDHFIKILFLNIILFVIRNHALHVCCVFSIFTNCCNVLSRHIAIICNIVLKRNIMGNKCRRFLMCYNILLFWWENYFYELYFMHSFVAGIIYVNVLQCDHLSKFSLVHRPFSHLRNYLTIASYMCINLSRIHNTQNFKHIY